MNEYKVITLHEPYASLLACGMKKNETRPKPTTWEGTYLIHAAKQWNKQQRDICKSELFREALHVMGLDHNDPKFNFGHIIGSFKVRGIYRIKSDKQSRSSVEDAFGDYSRGRYVWKGIEHKRLSPIPYKGAQGYYVPFKGDVKDIVPL